MVKFNELWLLQNYEHHHRLGVQYIHEHYVRNKDVHNLGRICDATRLSLHRLEGGISRGLDKGVQLALTSSTRSCHASSNKPRVGALNPKGEPNWISFLSSSFLLKHITNRSPPAVNSRARLVKNARRFFLDTFEYSSATAGLPKLIHARPLLYAGEVLSNTDSGICISEATNWYKRYTGVAWRN